MTSCRWETVNYHITSKPRGEESINNTTGVSIIFSSCVRRNPRAYYCCLLYRDNNNIIIIVYYTENANKNQWSLTRWQFFDCDGARVVQYDERRDAHGDRAGVQNVRRHFQWSANVNEISDTGCVKCPWIFSPFLSRWNDRRFVYRLIVRFYTRTGRKR